MILLKKQHWLNKFVENNEVIYIETIEDFEKYFGQPMSEEEQERHKKIAARYFFEGRNFNQRIWFTRLGEKSLNLDDPEK